MNADDCKCGHYVVVHNEDGCGCCNCKLTPKALKMMTPTKSNWEQIIEQDPTLEREWTARSKVLVLKEGELEIHLDYREWQGNFRYDLRMWAFIEGKWYPTKKGLVIFPQQIDRFVQLLQELVNGGG